MFHVPCHQLLGSLAGLGARLALVYNGCGGTSSRFPRPRFWSRYTADDTVTVSRGYDGADFPAIRDRVFGRIDAIADSGREYRAGGNGGTER